MNKKLIIQPNLDYMQTFLCSQFIYEQLRVLVVTSNRKVVSH